MTPRSVVIFIIFFYCLCYQKRVILRIIVLRSFLRDFVQQIFSDGSSNFKSSQTKSCNLLLDLSVNNILLSQGMILLLFLINLERRYILIRAVYLSRRTRIQIVPNTQMRFTKSAILKSGIEQNSAQKQEDLVVDVIELGEQIISY